MLVKGWARGVRRVDRGSPNARRAVFVQVMEKGAQGFTVDISKHNTE